MKDTRMWRFEIDLLEELNMDESLTDHDAWYTFGPLMLYSPRTIHRLVQYRTSQCSRACSTAKLKHYPTIEQTLRPPTTWKVSRSTIHSLAPFLHGLP